MSPKSTIDANWILSFSDSLEFILIPHIIQTFRFSCFSLCKSWRFLNSSSKSILIPSSVHKRYPLWVLEMPCERGKRISVIFLTLSLLFIQTLRFSLKIDPNRITFCFAFIFPGDWKSASNPGLCCTDPHKKWVMHITNEHSGESSRCRMLLQILTKN
jgi:hypothetical protein